jgi:hypothetical protein
MKKTPKVKRVQVRSGYHLCLKFHNGESRLFDMTPYLNKGIFRELKDKRYFRRVRIVWGGIEWPHEQDLSVDTRSITEVSLIGHVEDRLGKHRGHAVASLSLL